MSEQQSIREELAATIHENFNACRGRGGVSPDALAQVILASTVIRRIQAEAFRDGVNFIDNDASLSWGGSMVAGRNEAARRVFEAEGGAADV